jgi:aminotransferase
MPMTRGLDTMRTGRRLSSRLDVTTQSEIRKMSTECDRVGGINLSQGVCDTEVPVEVRRGAQQAIDDGFNSYTRQDGLAALRTEIAAKLARENEVSVDPESGVVVSAGATGAFYCACLALLNPGDEVVVFEPYYGYHVGTLEAVGAVPVAIPLTPPLWSFDPAAVEAAITPATRAMVINTPANPSGKVFSRDELGALADIATRHDLFVFTDEIYEYFVYDGGHHISPASLPGMAERTITISGFSKTYSITGWRLGFAACDPQWADAIGFYNDLIYVCAPSPLQLGAAAGLAKLPRSYYAHLRDEYSAKRELICDALRRAGMEPYVPAGAYYVLADASRVPGADSRARARELLRRTGVAAVPGAAFFTGDGGERILRFCFAKSQDQLEEACRRLAGL